MGGGAVLEFELKASRLLVNTLPLASPILTIFKCIILFIIIKGNYTHETVTHTTTSTTPSYLDYILWPYELLYSRYFM
jgi:hypothetical protein